MLVPFLEGFAMGASLIIAIGAQNAFILKQGLKKHHLFLTAITCFICDSVLIVLGVKGIGLIIENAPSVVNGLRWAGAIFLACYGLRSFFNVFKPNALVASLEDPIKQSKLATLLPLLAFTLLNPHTYIDTMLLLGSIGAQHPIEEHFPFIIGALIASFIWFFGLTYGASHLSRFFKNPRTWQFLEGGIALLMFSIAYSLFMSIE